MTRSTTTTLTNDELGAYIREFAAIWAEHCSPRGWRVPVDWAETIVLFANRGVAIDELEKFVFVTMARADKITGPMADREWRYWCGCVWGWLRRADIDTELLDF